jgi:hypothetical protein
MNLQFQPRTLIKLFVKMLKEYSIDFIFTIIRLMLENHLKDSIIKRQI